MPGSWGEYLRLRGALHGSADRLSEAYHDIAQSASVFELIGEGYQSALSHLALGRLASRVGARSQAEHQFTVAAALFESLGAARDLVETQKAASELPSAEATDPLASIGSDDAVVRRLIDAAAFPELLGHETAAAVRDTLDADCAVVFVAPRDADVRPIAWTGGDGDRARAIAMRADRPLARHRIRRLGADRTRRRRPALHCRPLAAAYRGDTAAAAEDDRRNRGARLRFVRRPPAAGRAPAEIAARTAARAAAARIPLRKPGDDACRRTDSAPARQRAHRADHRRERHWQRARRARDSRGVTAQLGGVSPYNCTTTTRDLADSQLFGHRRGSFTGAVNDQLGLVRTATGGTLFLDEIGDLPLDVQPKLLRFLEQGEIMPIGDTRPQRVDVRVIAATNADLEQRVAEGKFREDLYYRLAVIRIVIPPLRDRREEIPHLTSLFMREVSERLGKPDVFLMPDTLELLAQHWWPGNVRQLRNEIQRLVALSRPGQGIGPEHLSPEITSAAIRQHAIGQGPSAAARLPFTTLSAAVDGLEREIIEATLHQSSGNISEAARSLGLTRRGLYLKLRRLGFETTPFADTK